MIRWVRGDEWKNARKSRVEKKKVGYKINLAGAMAETMNEHVTKVKNR